MDGSISLDESRARAKRRRFEVKTLRLRGIRWVLAMIGAHLPPWVFGLLRTLLPTVKVPGWRYLWGVPVPTWRCWVLVTRNEDVKVILERDDVFNVWWGAQLRELNDGKVGGTPFILGLDRTDCETAQYRDGLAQVMQAFRRDDIARIVRPAAARRAEDAIAAAAGGPLDAIQSLVVDISLDTCSRYFGVPVMGPKGLEATASGAALALEDELADREVFYTWTVAASGLLFGPPFERDRGMETARAATDRLALVVDIAIDAALRAKAASAQLPDNVLSRLAAPQRGDPVVTPLMMRSIMSGMITGSVPTNAIAFGHILDTLLDQPNMMSSAQAAARAGDDGFLTRCLFEAMRFKPLNPGPWRRCGEDTWLARGTPREVHIGKGSYVLASTQSAMFDPRSVKSPRRFDPTRDPSDLLHFGHGLHWCVAKYMAETQITQAMKPLLLRSGLRRASNPYGKPDLLGLFPMHLFVQFDGK